MDTYFPVLLSQLLLLYYESPEKSSVFPGIFQNKILILLECSTECLLRPACAVSRNADMLGCAAVIFIVNALHCLAGNLQAAFWCLKDIFKETTFVFVEASAAGLLFFFCIMAIRREV